MSPESIEIHGYLACPFAWRVRLLAAEKGVATVFIPCDVDAPDPRAAAHNPEEHSPLLYEAGFSLGESEVIMQYLDEGHAGRALMPEDARARAELRLDAVHLRPLDVHMERNRPEARRRSEPAIALLERTLGGRPFLHGDEPGYTDCLVIPFATDLFVRRLINPRTTPGAAAYVARAAARPSFEATRPPWAIVAASPE